MLHLDARWLGAIREEAAEMRSTGVDDEPIRLVRNAWVYARFCRLNALLFSEASVHDKEAALIGFIGDCDDVHGKPIALPPGDPARHRQLLPVMDFLRCEDGDTVPLTELADMAGMSRYQLIRAFRASTGMTPHAWQLNQRVNRARERLLAGEELADVAHRLGFADQSHFQRVFKAHAGVTPGRYRA